MREITGAVHDGDAIRARDDRRGLVQVWIDPDYPDAHHDPALRDYLARLGERDGIVALIRPNANEAFSLWPPAMCPDGEFHATPIKRAALPQWGAWPAGTGPTP